jgi:hypothetical protein
MGIIYIFITVLFNIKRATSKIPCAIPTFDISGNLDLKTVLFDCTKNIPSIQSPPRL